MQVHEGRRGRLDEAVVDLIGQQPLIALEHLEHLAEMAMFVAEGRLGLGPLLEFGLQLLVSGDQIGRPLLYVRLQLTVGPLRGFLGLSNRAKERPDGGNAHENQDRIEQAEHVAPVLHGIENRWTYQHADQDAQAANRHRQHGNGNQDPSPVHARDADQPNRKDSGRRLEDQGDGADNNKSKVVHAKRIMTTRQDARTVVRRAFQPDFVRHCQAGKPDVLSIPAGGCMMKLAGQRQELSKTTQEVRAADNQVYASLVEIVTGRSAV